VDEGFEKNTKSCATILPPAAFLRYVSCVDGSFSSHGCDDGHFDSTKGHNGWSMLQSHGRGACNSSTDDCDGLIDEGRYAIPAAR